MRILIVIHGYPPTFIGGAELRAERTARALAAANHDVAVLCVETVNAQETMLVDDDQPQDGVRVYRLHVQNFATLTEGDHNGDQGMVSRSLEQVIGAWQPAIIHLFSGYLMGSCVITIAKAYHIPIVVSLTDYWWLCHRINLVRTNGTRCDGPEALACARCQSEVYRRYRLLSTMAQPLVDGLWQVAGQMPMLRDHLHVGEHTSRLISFISTLNQADALIAPSRFLAEMYMRYGVDAKLIRTWRQGIDLSYCPLRKASPALRFSYLGQIKHHKGIHTLIDAWGLLRGARQRSLTLYGWSLGEEAYGARLRKQSRQLEGVRWERPLAHADVWQALAETDVLMMTSRWHENSPNVILEAQAMGVPVIGTNLGGIAELVQHGRNGLLFAPDDAADLAAQMRRLLEEPDLLEALRQHPIPFRGFQDEIDQIEGLYRQLAAKAPAPAVFEEVLLGKLT